MRVNAICDLNITIKKAFPFALGRSFKIQEIDWEAYPAFTILNSVVREIGLCVLDSIDPYKMACTLYIGLRSHRIVTRLSPLYVQVNSVKSYPPLYISFTAVSFRTSIETI